MTIDGELGAIEAAFPYKQYYAADVGANDGTFLSLTKHLEERGWRVLCIEPNTFYEEALRKARHDVLMVACGAQSVDNQVFHRFVTSENTYASLSSLAPASPSDNQILVPVRTLNWCLEQANFPCLDFLCIDVEGTEIDVLMGFDISRWHPRLIIAENWPYKPQPIAEYLTPFGYRMLKRTTDNEIYLLEAA